MTYVEFLGIKKDKSSDGSNSLSQNSDSNQYSTSDGKSSKHMSVEESTAGSKSLSIEEPPSPYRKSRDTKFDLGLKSLNNKLEDSPPPKDQK